MFKERCAHRIITILLNKKKASFALSHRSNLRSDQNTFLDCAHECQNTYNHRTTSDTVYNVVVVMVAIYVNNFLQGSYLKDIHEYNLHTQYKDHISRIFVSLKYLTIRYNLLCLFMLPHLSSHERKPYVVVIVVS